MAFQETCFLLSQYELEFTTNSEFSSILCWAQLDLSSDLRLHASLEYLTLF